MTTPRHHFHPRSLLATVAMAIPAMLIGYSLSAPSAQAGYIVTLAQQGPNVVATGSGTLDLADLGSPILQFAGTEILPSAAETTTGQEAFDHVYGLASGGGALDHRVSGAVV